MIHGIIVVLITITFLKENKMRKLFTIVYIFSMTLVADVLEEKNQKVLNTSDGVINEFSKVFNEENQKSKFLLLSTDMNLTTFVMMEYYKKHERFTNLKNNLKKIDNKQLIDFYITSLKINRNVKFIDSIELLARLGYEERVLNSLKEDLIKYNLPAKVKQQLLESIKNLLILTNEAIYKLIEERNRFYTKNIKQYINSMMKKPIKYIIYNKNTYQKFISYLNKGEMLLGKGIKSNNFQLFNEFIKNDLMVSDEEIRIFKKDSFNVSLSTDYWIRTQVYLRYIGIANTHSMLIHKIETQKTFFENLLKI